MCTVPVDGEYDPTVMRFLHIRTHLRAELATGKYPYRVDITWPYDGAVSYTHLTLPTKRIV